MKKKLVILAVLVFGSIGMINAQEHQKNEGPRKPPSVEERMKHVKETLAKDASLSADKQQKVMDLFKQFFIKADKVAPPPPNKEEMDKLVKERDEAVAKVLTAEEFKRYKEAEKKLRPPHPPKPGEGGENPPPPPPQN